MTDAQQPERKNDANRCYVCGKAFEEGITIQRDEHGWKHVESDSRCTRPHTPALEHKGLRMTFDPGCDCMACKSEKEQYNAAIARTATLKAREEYANGISDIIDEISRQQLEYGMVSDPISNNAKEMLESLRAAGEQ
jgi:hypothetical protein